MAKEIDLSKKLSDEDRSYLYQRNRWKDVLANYNEFGGEEPLVPTGVPVTGPASLVNAAGLDGLTAEQQAAYQDGQPSDEPVEYEKLTKAQLQEELDSRKADAQTDEEKSNLDHKGNETKDQLIARLDRDDELVASRS